VVTPFTGFVLSDLYLSSEIDELGLRFLNSTARRLTNRSATRSTDGAVIYCQVDQLDEFAERYLPRLRERFLLISGKWHLPPLSMSLACRSILRSPLLMQWYSQNQVFDVPIRPFPYGMHLGTAPAVSARMGAMTAKQRTVYVPHASVHAHLSGAALAIRVSLAPYMESLLPLTDYLDMIASSEYVVSPPGDRPDTYRHWEAIALSAVPISVLPEGFRRLFGSALLATSDLMLPAQGVIVGGSSRPDPALATVDYWRELIRTPDVRPSGALDGKILSHSEGGGP
jgi:hypothetical protein